MHQTGSPSTMHEVLQRADIINTLIDYFKEKKRQFAAIGLNQWIIDPGFGFSKTKAENFELVKSIAALKTLDLPILLGVSRKSSIYKTLGVDANAALNGTTVLNTIGLMGGANILRVHDVKEAKEAIILINEMNA
jgi:dihydropteroate synthase